MTIPSFYIIDNEAGEVFYTDDLELATRLRHDDTYYVICTKTNRFLAFPEVEIPITEFLPTKLELDFEDTEQ